MGASELKAQNYDLIRRRDMLQIQINQLMQTIQQNELKIQQEEEKEKKAEEKK